MSSSPISLTIDELTRLQISIRIQPTPTGFSFNLQPVPTYHNAPRLDHLQSAMSSHSVCFHPTQDEFGPVLQVFAIANPGTIMDRGHDTTSPVDMLMLERNEFAMFGSSHSYDQTLVGATSMPPNLAYSTPQQYTYRRDAELQGHRNVSQPTRPSYDYPSSASGPSTSLSSQTMTSPYSAGSSSTHSNASHSPSSYSSEEGSTHSYADSPESFEGLSPTDSHSGSNARFACMLPECPRRFTSQYTLKLHMNAHQPKQRKYLPCSVEGADCDEKFSRQHDRLRHEVQKHGRISEFVCDDCRRFFSSKRTLGSHKCPTPAGGATTRWVTSG